MLESAHYLQGQNVSQGIVRLLGAPPKVKRRGQGLPASRQRSRQRHKETQSRDTLLGSATREGELCCYATLENQNWWNCSRLQEMGKTKMSTAAARKKAARRTKQP
eukprot:1161444-Pelagomonas_calceolata.AAC.10